MSRRLSLPAGSPVTVTVSPLGGKTGGSGSPGDGVVRRGSGITSPVSRHSIGSSTATLQVSPVRRSGGGSRYASRDGAADGSAEFVHYTVHIPPTPDRATVASAAASTDAPAAEEEVRPQRSYVSATIFTGGLNCATRGHVLADAGAARPAASANMSCKMRGCDMPAFPGAGRGGHPPCECGFMICQECYADCVAAAGNGNCPGCKEPYSAGSDTDDSVDEDDDEAVSSSEERDRMPMTSMAKRFSMVHSIKMPMASTNGKPADFDHARWLFETKGTYGYGNALWPKNGHGGAAAAAGATTGFVGIEEPPNFGARCRRPLTRKTSVSQAILSPYRY
jgi:1,4-beta-D-xylan synthase